MSVKTTTVQLDWPQINQLLELGQYEQAATLLHKAQVADRQTGNTALNDILTAAHQICLACGQCQAEVAWHHNAHAEVVQREFGLKQQLQTMLDLASSRGPPETSIGRVISPPVPTTGFGLAEHAESEPEKHFGLWQWTQKLLGRKPDLQSIAPETATGSIETLAMFPAEEIEETAGDFSGKAEILPPPPTEEIEIPTPPFTAETRGDAVLPVQEETEPVDISSLKEAALLTVEAQAASLPLTKESSRPYRTPPMIKIWSRKAQLCTPPPMMKIWSRKAELCTPTKLSSKEIGPAVPFPLPPDTAKTKSLSDKIIISTAEEANLVIVEEQPDQQGSPTLVVYCLGSFRVYQADQPIQDWKSSKGKAIFKYLVVHRGVPMAKEVLMDLFWPDAMPDAARNNLNVAIYGLRQTLRQTRPDLSHILFQDDYYLLKPELQIWVDVEAFIEHVRLAQNLEQRGELTLAIREYRAAEVLYQGEFLADDRYEDWPIPQRQRLEADYFSLLDRLSRYYLDQEDYDACATVCKKILAVDPCREEAHCRLMRYYSQQNQRYLALRQYHLCIEALANELDVGPSQATIELYEQIRRAQ